MGIPLTTATDKTINPSIKSRAPGHWVDVAIINVVEVPRMEFGTDQQRLSRTGKPQTQDVITGLVIAGTAQVNIDDVDRTVEAGEVVAIFVAGRDRWDKDGDATRSKGEPKSWSGAKADHGALNVGDVLRWKYEADQPGQGATPRKVRTFLLRRARPGEEAQTARCEELYRAETAVQLEAPLPGGRGDWDDEEPFMKMGGGEYDFRNLHLEL